ncbi:putative MFS multidrug transporter [Talaromyces proteolyticus]|uniref:MFS multidrug transporter n=1 Tax=Talaromyces proteolyticus TaxID=1131652 RepID=A0AAD4KRK2_9EURO|nr:putative MFS multidrug transporter [Talaromyces proteolyticus]KAH8694952.1 putative MFS multidrug transporter [Talaromyces proteolyticus]
MSTEPSNAPPTEPKCTFVDFDGPDDPANPWNWPVGKRRLLSAIIALSTMFVAMGSSIFAKAIPSLMATHGISREVSTLGVSLYVLGFATGPIIWSSLSELKGRYLPLTTSMFGFSVFCFATARSGNDLASIFICRYFTGFFGAGPLTLASAAFADMYRPKELAPMITLYALTVFLGPLISQPIGGFIVLNESLGWEWTEYLPGILGSVAFFSLLILLPESYRPVILARKADRLRRETGDWSIISKHDTIALDLRTVSREYLFLPLRMLALDPIVLCMCTFGAFVYGLLYLFLTAYPIIFQQIYHMNPGVGGLPYLGIMVGQCLCVIATLIYQRMWVFPRLHMNKGQMKPEWTIPLAIPGAAAFSAGLFWLGWSGYRGEVHWIVPTASGVLSGFGLLAMFVPSVSYIVNARQNRSASAVAAHMLFRSIFGAVFPLFATYMFQSLGVEWACTLLGCVAALMLPIPLILYLYGERIRKSVKIEY